MNLVPKNDISAFMTTVKSTSRLARLRSELLLRPLPQGAVEFTQTDPVFTGQRAALLLVCEIRIDRVPGSSHAQRFQHAKINDGVAFRIDGGQNGGREGDLKSAEATEH